MSQLLARDHALQKSPVLLSLLQALMEERLSSVLSPDGTLISASAAPHCGGNRDSKERESMETESCEGGGGEGLRESKETNLERVKENKSQ